MTEPTTKGGGWKKQGASSSPMKEARVRLMRAVAAAKDTAKPASHGQKTPPPKKK